jgi:hypothetical protein
MGALVRLAAADGADDPDAVLVVLHLLSGGVHALAANSATCPTASSRSSSAN